eukprot:m.97832 g.97832  ORF g.97832 m.97832 type:complete len:440 (+) comp15545_c1_seq1:72-1391(+)
MQADAAAGQPAAEQQRRVFKKASPSGDLMVYLPKRDFYDHGTHVDRIDGMLTYEPMLEPRFGLERKVFARLNVTIRYTDDAADNKVPLLLKDLYVSTICVAPAAQDRSKWTSVQKKLAAKLGDRGYAFSFVIPAGLPDAISLFLPRVDPDIQHGCEYKLLFYAADSEKGPMQKESTVNLTIRKLSYQHIPQIIRKPFAHTEQKAMLSSGSVHAEADLDKEVYFHGDDIVINLNVNNQSTRTVKSITVSIQQLAHMKIEGPNRTFNSTAKTYPALLETKTGCPIKPGMQSAFSYKMKFSFDESRLERNTALAWHVRGAEKQLAASSMLVLDKERCPPGLCITYAVKIKLILTGMGGDAVLKMPFMLANFPPPKKDKSSPTKAPVEKQASAGTLSAIAAAEADVKNNGVQLPFVDEEDDDDDLDFMFEEFVRSRADKMFAN